MTNQDSFKIFDIYDISQMQVKDPSLKPYINLSGKIMLKSQGRRKEKFANIKVNVVERLANRLAVPGHVGKKHRIITSWSSGKYNKNMKTVLEALRKIQEKTGKNPIQILIDAIENGSPKDEITVIEHAGARYPQAVDCSPIRRINLAIRWIVQGAYARSFGKKIKMSDSLANEIISASKGSMDSYSISKKNESEKQADAAR
ncbi:MAG: 30S ribosomal protein S7 [Nanoarchaeota archaeon]